MRAYNPEVSGGVSRKKVAATVWVTFLFWLMIATPATSRAQNKPNILFCIWDDASYPHQSISGCNWCKTPTFDSIARKGLLFTNAYTTNSKSGPSRSCILTGRYSWQLEDMANHWATWPSKFKSWPEALSKNGYFVGYTGKGWAPGCAGSAYLTGPIYSSRTITPPTNQISNTDYAGNFTDFYNAKPANTPFSFWVGGREPHRSYVYQSGVNRGGKKLTDISEVPAYWPDNPTVRNDILDYALEVEWFDTQVGKILTFLQQRNELNNTMVVFTSDNGMPFPRCKGQTYEISNHLPLAVMWRNGIVSPGRVITDYVNFIDFAPTFLDVAGVSQAASQMQPISGRSITNIFYSSRNGQVDSTRNYIILGRERQDVGRPGEVGYPVRAIIKNGFQYLFNFKPDRWPSCNPEAGYPDVDGSPTKTQCIQARFVNATFKYWLWSFGKRDSSELYQLTADKYCVNNLIQNPAYATTAAELRTLLFGELAKQNDPRVLGNGDVFDAYVNCGSQHNNWYARLMAGQSVDMSWFNKSDIDSAVIPYPPTWIDDEGNGPGVPPPMRITPFVLVRRASGIAVESRCGEMIRAVRVFDLQGARLASITSAPAKTVSIDSRCLSAAGARILKVETNSETHVLKSLAGK